jgi:hypothetical protein
MIEKVCVAGVKNYKMKMPNNKTDLKWDFETGHFHVTNKNVNYTLKVTFLSRLCKLF